MTQTIRYLWGSALSSLFVLGMVGCANYEVNLNRGGVPGYYIRTEMQDSDRALDAARQAGKDKSCPAEFQAAEEARNKAYDVFRACHTEEGAALARQATAKANALCSGRAAVTPLFTPGEAEAATTPPAEAAAQPKAAANGAQMETAAAAGAADRVQYCVALNIEFDIDRATIRPQYHDEVTKVGDFMKKYPSTTAVIEGYTDEVGSAEFNMELSKRRAESVVKALENDYGIDPSRLQALGYGKSKPVADNATDEGKQKNRRINAVIDCALDAKEAAISAEKLCMTLKAEFATDSAQIRSTDTEGIDRVGEYLKQYPTTTAVIEGHTDSTGSAGHNMKLSLRRAESIVNYLVKNYGIDRSRLTAKGFGATRRIAYDNTTEGRQKNRRIDAIIDCVTSSS